MFTGTTRKLAFPGDTIGYASIGTSPAGLAGVPIVTAYADSATGTIARNQGEVQSSTPDASNRIWIEILWTNSPLEINFLPIGGLWCRDVVGTFYLTLPMSLQGLPTGDRLVYSLPYPEYLDPATDELVINFTLPLMLMSTPAVPN